MNVEHDFIDNSRVILNDGSSIKYDERKWGSERMVELKGEAFFEVEAGQLFQVETINGVVQVFGYPIHC